MKKMYIMTTVLLSMGLAWCTLKGPTIPEISTGDVQVSTGEEISNTGTINEIIDSSEVPMVSGSEDVAQQQSGVMAEVQKIIDERNAQPKEEKDNTESDVDVWDKTIQAIKNL